MTNTSSDVPQQGRPQLRPGDEAKPGTPGTGEGICPHCSGTGRIANRTCPDCEGTGRIIQGIGGG